MGVKIKSEQIKLNNDKSHMDVELNNDDQEKVERLTQLVQMALVDGLAKEVCVNETVLCEVVAEFGASVLKLIYDLWQSTPNGQLYKMIDTKFNALKPIDVDYTEIKLNE